MYVIDTRSYERIIFFETASSFRRPVMADVVVSPQIRALYAGNPRGLEQYKKRVRAERKKDAEEKATEEIRNENFGYFVRPTTKKESEVDLKARQLRLPL